MGRKVTPNRKKWCFSLAVWNFWRTPNFIIYEWVVVKFGWYLICLIWHLISVGGIVLCTMACFLYWAFKIQCLKSGVNSFLWPSVSKAIVRIWNPYGDQDSSFMTVMLEIALEAIFFSFQIVRTSITLGLGIVIHVRMKVIFLFAI